MKKEFYIGQPLIIKETGDRVTFTHDDGRSGLGCSVLAKAKDRGRGYICYYEYEEIEPSTEFKFSEIITGLEQGYFEEGTEFEMTSTGKTIKVKQGGSGLYVDWLSQLLPLTSKEINSTWQLVEHRKEMTLEEIETELGYKIKLKDNKGN